MKRVALPLFLESVPAGFPSPAQDYVENRLDLNELMIARPAATYFVRVSGDSMRDAGIIDQDLLIVDRSINPKQGDVVVAELDGGFIVKILVLKPSVQLLSKNPNYPPISIEEGMTLSVFGVVTGVIRQLKRC